jgi:hypothetical protein
MKFKQLILGALLMSTFINSSILSKTFSEKVTPNNIELVGKVAVGVGAILVIHGLMRNIEGEGFLSKAWSASSKMLELGVGAVIFTGGSYAFIFSEELFEALYKGLGKR